MKIKRIKSVLTLSFTMMAGVALATGEKSTKTDEAASRPNVVVILADDLGCRDMSLYNGWVKTPNIDKMAREGVRFTDFHSNSSVCSPTRAAFLTGRYQQRVDIIDVIASHLDTPGLDPSELTIPRLMQQNGYRTALFGKWHLGVEPENNPIHHGFDEFIGFLPGGCNYLLHKDWYDGTERKEQEGYSTDIITEKSVDFIQRNKENPFFLYVAHQAVHNYYIVPTDSVGTKGPDIPLEGDVARERYQVILRGLDQSVGEIMAAIKEAGLDENTLVFFFSDNGDVQLNPNEDQYVYRGGKFSNYEGGHRVPAVARWPGHISAGWDSDDLAVGMDLFPTIMDITGVDMLNKAPIPERQVFFGYEPKLGTAMRDGHWKMQTKGDVVELYDLSKDIKETADVKDKYPGRTQKMKAAIEQWKLEVSPDNK